MNDSDRLLREIREDHRSGAVTLTLKASEALRSLLQELQAQPKEHRHPRLQGFAQQLIEAQPEMGSIRNLARKVLDTSQSMPSGSVLQAIEDFVHELEKSSEKIAQHAVKLIPANSPVMTISHSLTVFQTMKTARREGKAFSVVCPESRPLCEGVDLAQRLHELGVPVTICADGLAPSFVSQCDAVLVGGDALAPEGLVNKIGTYPLALAAREAKVPFVALIGTQKFLCHFDSGWIREHDPRELVPNAKGNTPVCNRYFDLTPLALLTKVVTEKGIHSMEEIKEMLAS